MNKPARAPRIVQDGGLRHVFALFIASRVLLYGVALLAPYLFAPQSFSPGNASQAGWAEYWQRWDANWYASIATQGYSFDQHTASSAAFFPLLPLMMRPLILCGLPTWVSGLLISNLGTAALLLVFYRWMQREFPATGVPENATTLLAFCPQSCWFILGYSEPLYLLTAVWALSLARRQRWWAAAAIAIAHGLSRSNGIVLVLPLLAIAAPDLVGALKRRNWRTILARSASTGGALVGHATYLLYLQIKFGTWQAHQITSVAGWGVCIDFSVLSILQKIPGYGFHVGGANMRAEWIAWSWVLALAFSLFAAGILIRLNRPWFWIASILGFWSLLLLTAEANWLTSSICRYAAALFPIPVALALFAEKHRWAFTAFLAFNSGAACLITALVFTGHHIT
jgi:hypothetical protein